MQETSPHRAVESRAAARTNLFLAATLNFADGAHPVKIRDLSATGAKIETSLIPEVGAAVSLVRGRLSVHAQVSWTAERFCGLRFDSAVAIQEWMTNPVVLERRGKRPRIDAPGNVPPVAQEISRIACLLGTLRKALAGDPQVVLKHGTRLHDLGVAERTLADLAGTMQADALEASARTGRRDQRRF